MHVLCLAKEGLFSDEWCCNKLVGTRHIQNISRSRSERVDVFIGLDEGTVISQNGCGENIALKLNIMGKNKELISIALGEKSFSEKGENIMKNFL